MNVLDGLGWPLERAAEALQALAIEARLPLRATQLPATPSLDAAGLASFLVTAPAWLGLEVEAVEAPYSEIDALVAALAPGLALIAGPDGPRLLALFAGGRRLRAIGPDLRLQRIDPSLLRAALVRPLEEPAAADVERTLDEAKLVGPRRARARAALLRERLAARRVGDLFLVKAQPGAPLSGVARRARLPQKVVGLLAAHLAEYTLYLLSWWVIGRGALDGRIDTGWLAAWLLILLTMLPLRMLGTALSGDLAFAIGALLKQRLLVGALALEPEEIRNQGAGQLLGRVIESNVVERLAVDGGLAGLTATLELIVSGAVIGAGAAGRMGALLLAAWVALSVVLARRYLSERRRWTEQRMELTHDLVERMVGHRTRLAQERPRDWHDGEDQQLERYLTRSSALDRLGALFSSLIPRGWLVVGVASLGPAFVSGRASATQLAVGLGGILLAYQALRRFRQGLYSLAGAAIAWRQVAPLSDAATRSSSPGAPGVSWARRAAEKGDTLLEAHDLVFRYRDRGEPVLRGAGLRIAHGQRLLVEGPSGGGKSTLLSLLSGLRTPESGLLLLRGLDRHTLGAHGWRSRVVAAPQFHENHVLTGTFAYNLLLGRTWPPSLRDLADAEAICAELGLGDVLSRMPAGLQQMVGETGWQLSHGERNRVYMARALLQDADLVLLDESFAALDPETLRTALHCALARAPTLMVIAHP